MVALAVLAIAVPVLLRSVSQGTALAGESRFLAVASLLAQEKMTTLFLDPTRLPASGSGDFGEQFPGYAWRLVEQETDDSPWQSGGFSVKKFTLRVVSRLSPEWRYELVRYAVAPPQE